jgi:hypothetical protein
VALKVLREQYADDEEFVERFGIARGRQRGGRSG